MCGIIGVVRRRTHASAARARAARRRARRRHRAPRRLAAVTSRRSTAAAARSSASTPRSAAFPVSVRSCSAIGRARSRIEHRADALADLLAGAEAALDAATRASSASPTSRRSTPRCCGPRTRRGRCATTGSARARAVGDLAGPDASDGGDRGVHLGPGRALGARPARGARPRLRRAPRPRARPRARPRRPGGRAAARAPRATTRCSSDGAVRTPDGLLSFVYKAAAEIGELGDNTRRLRAAIRDDELLHLALASDAAEVVVLGHTRWASVGIISEPNAHPLNSRGGRAAPTGRTSRRRSTATSTTTPTSPRSRRLRLPAEITTDAKVIPALVSRRLARGCDAARGVPRDGRDARGLGRDRCERRRRTRPSSSSRCAAAARRSTSGSPRTRSSSRASRTGSSRRPSPYLRLDGETPADADARRARPAARSSSSTPTHAGDARRDRAPRLRRHAAAGHRGRPAARADHDPRHRPRRRPALPPQGDLRGAGLVPQDAARARSSTDGDGRLHVALGAETLPHAVRARLATGAIRRVVVIGQGTAAVAGQSLAAALRGVAGRPARSSRRCSRPSSRASACATTCATRSSSRSARAAPPPTRTAPSTSRATAARPCSRS